MYNKIKQIINMKFDYRIGLMFILFMTQSAYASGTMGLSGVFEFIVIMIFICPLLFIMSLLAIIFFIKNKFSAYKFFLYFTVTTCILLTIAVIAMFSFVSSGQTDNDIKVMTIALILNGALALFLPVIQFIKTKHKNRQGNS